MSGRLKNKRRERERERENERTTKNQKTEGLGCYFVTESPKYPHNQIGISWRQSASEKHIECTVSEKEKVKNLIAKQKNSMCFLSLSLSLPLLSLGIFHSLIASLTLSRVIKCHVN